MTSHENNHAFIDTQNLYRGVKARGWQLDWSRFRIHLQETYDVNEAYLFIGYIPKYKFLYDRLTTVGFKLVFKPTVRLGKGKQKGNVDMDLGVHALTTMNAYDRAVIVSSDGDFCALVQYFDRTEKLRSVISPHVSTCSVLLRKAAKGRIEYLESARTKVEHRLSSD